MAFAPPPADALDLLDAGGGVLDVRSGDRWDLFFPGYFKSSSDNERTLSEPVFPTRMSGHMPRLDLRPRRPSGQDFLGDWYFNPDSFDAMRYELEHRSRGRFVYDGRPTLVVVQATYDEGGEPEVDWPSLAMGPLSDRRHGVRSLSLSEVVHRISTDLEQGSEDPNWGVGAVLSPQGSKRPRRTAAAEIGIAATGGTLAFWLNRMLGL